MVPTPDVFMEDFYYEVSNFSLISDALRNNDIEMVKLLMKYSKEKNVSLHIQTWTHDFERNLNAPELALELGFVKMAQLFQDVYDGKINVKDLNPVIKRNK